MQLIEAERGPVVSDLPSHLTIPVIMTRHPVSLPPQIANSTMYVDFSRFTMATPDMKSNPDFIFPAVEKMVAAHRPALCELQKISTQLRSRFFKPIRLPDVPPEWRSLPSLSFPKK